MSNPNPKPPAPATRRIKWLAVSVIVVIAVYTGGWFYVARQLGEVVTVQIGNLEEQDITVECPDRDVRGYPFRIGLFCSDFSVDVPRDQLQIDGGALRSAAQVYEPRRAIVEIDAPLTVALGDTKARLDYAIGQAVVEARAAGRRAVSVEFTDGSGSIGGLVAQWDRLTVFSREAGGNLELAAQGVGLAFEFEQLPSLSTDVDAVIEGASYDIRTLRGKSGTLRRLTVGLSDDRGLLAQGPFTVAADGLLDAEITVRVVDVPGVVAQLEASSPRIAAAVSGVLALGPVGGENGDEVELTVTVRRGQARLGILPIGTVPAL